MFLTILSMNNYNACGQYTPGPVQPGGNYPSQQPGFTTGPVQPQPGGNYPSQQQPGGNYPSQQQPGGNYPGQQIPGGGYTAVPGFGQQPGYGLQPPPVYGGQQPGGYGNNGNGNQQGCSTCQLQGGIPGGGGDNSDPCFTKYTNCIIGMYLFCFFFLDRYLRRFCVSQCAAVRTTTELFTGILQSFVSSQSK